MGETKRKSGVDPIFLWVDRDRSIFAEKDKQAYALRFQSEHFPAEVDPFSGIH